MLEHPDVNRELKNKFVVDFIDNMASIKLDSDTWNFLYKRITNVLESQFLPIHMEKDKFLKLIRSRDKFQAFFNRLSDREKKDLLEILFFPKKVEEEKKYASTAKFYQAMADQLVFPVYHVGEKENTLYYPTVIFAQTSAVGKYIAAITGTLWTTQDQQVSKRNDNKAAPELKVDDLLNTISSKAGTSYSVCVTAEVAENFFAKIQNKELPSIAKQIRVLQALKSSPAATSLGGISDNEFKRIKAFWFPPESGAELKPEVIDFLIQQIQVMNAGNKGRSMFGNYPKNYAEAAAALDRHGKSDLTSIYQAARENCLLITNKTMQQSLLNLLDEVFIIAAKESTVKPSSSYYSNAERLLKKIENDLITKAMQNQPIDLEQMKDWSDLQAIKSTYTRFGRWIRNWWFGAETFKSEEKQFSDVISAVREAAMLDKRFARVVSQGKPMEPVTLRSAKKKGSGVTAGQQCTVLDEQKNETTYMVKQGKNWGETLSEHLASLELQANARRRGCLNQAAATQLWLESKDAKSTASQDIGSEVFVASQYYDSDYTVTAATVGGYATRPKAAYTFSKQLFMTLIDLNKALPQLGLEEVIHAAVRMGDFDLHTENVLLLIDLKDVKPEDLQHAKRLVKNFNEIIKNHLNESGMSNIFFSRKSQEYIQLLAGKIREIEGCGGRVFFQKIDHGNSYYNEGTVVRLDEHATLPVRLLPGGGVEFVPTNHAAEFIATGQDNLVLTEASCKILLENSLEFQLQDIQEACDTLFAELYVIAKQKYPEDEAKQKEAECHLLNELYMHVTNGEKYNKPPSVKDLQQEIVKLIKDGRKKRVEQHEKDYLFRLGALAAKQSEDALGPNQKKLLETLRSRYPEPTLSQSPN